MTSAAPPPISLPPYEDIDAWVTIIYKNTWGLDSIPVSTIDKNLEKGKKRVEWFANWLDHKKNPMPQKIFEEFKTHPEHSYSKLKGIGLIVGQVKYGPNKGYWINFFDADNELGKQCILQILGYSSVDELKRDCVVEYHPSAPHKFHVYVLSVTPFANFTLSTDRNAIKRGDVPGIEIKGQDSGLAYPTPSLYATDIGKPIGEHYQLVDGSTPVPTRLFSEQEVEACEERLHEIGTRYGNKSYGKRPIEELLHKDFRAPAGSYRKRYIIQMGMHYLNKFNGDEEKAAEKTREWNEIHCDPPLTYEYGGKFDDAWEAANRYYDRQQVTEAAEEEEVSAEKETEGKEQEKPKESKKEQNIKTATRIVEDHNILWFHDEYQTGYMRVKVKNHFEIYRVNKRDRRFKLFITKMYYDATGGSTLKDDELAEVMRALEAKATFSDVCKNIKLRKSWLIKSVDQENFTEEYDKNIIFYDMCTPHWTCIMVDGYAGAWSLLPYHPESMPFYRYQQRPQVNPKLPGEYEFDILDQWLDKMLIIDPKARLTFKVWIINFFVPMVPNPMLIPSGMQGAAKSTLSKQIQKVTDPYAGEPLMLPESRKEAAQQAHHRAILIYDNIEYEIPKWLSDFLSQLVTGATVSKRELYSDDNDVLYHLMLSVVLNGLQTPKLKPDAKDRTIELPMERIEDEHRKEQAEIDKWFEDHLPDILGKIFDTLAKSMQIFPTVKLAKLPRMADFMRRGVSIARALAKEGDRQKEDADTLQRKFIEAYTDVIKRQNFEVIESNSVADAFVRWVSDYLEQGKETESKNYKETGKAIYSTGSLLNILTMKGPSMGFDIKDKEWPKKPALFVKDIKSAAADIRHAHQIDIKVSRDSNNNSQIEIRNLQDNNKKSDSGPIGPTDGGNDAASPGDVSPGVGGGGGGEIEQFSLRNRESFVKSPPPPPVPPETQESSSNHEVNSGGESGIISAPPYLPPVPPEEKAQIEHEFVPSGGAGNTGGSFEKLSLFRIEEFSTTNNLSSPHPPSLIDHIKQSAVAIDPEWDNRPGMDDKMLQFNFYDSQGKNWVLNAQRDFEGSESKLLDAAEATIRNYKVVLTYFEKGENMGFSKWDKRCQALGKASPIFMGYRQDSKDACINIANKDGELIKDIDLGLVYQMPIIENFLHNVYLSNELGEVSQALLGEGKLSGASGEFFVEMPLEQQIAYGLKDAELTYRLAGANNYAVLSMLEKIGQRFIGGSFADLAKMCSTGPNKWWATLFKNKFNAQPSPTAIKRKGEKGELKGGHVEEIKEIKEYRWVVVFDFRGQYPSIISRYNICFTTACCDCCKDNPHAYVMTGLPEVDSNRWWFCRKQRGILPRIVDTLVAMRAEFKAKMRTANTKESAQEFDVMQNACKLLANSLYGVFGEPNFEFGDLRVANTITGYGRAKVLAMGKAINEAYPYLTSVYHDTDSAFIMGLEPQNGRVGIDENHPIVKDIIARISAPESEAQGHNGSTGGTANGSLGAAPPGGLGLPLEYKKCYKKVMIKASKNYMGLDAATGKIETVGLVGKKRNQCKFVRNAFEQQREYWRHDAPKEVIEGHINDLIYRLDTGKIPLEELQEKTTIGLDPWTGYSPKAQHTPGCVLGRKYNRRVGESSPPYYLAKQSKKKKSTDGGTGGNDLSFTEDPSQIDYNKYKERLRTALEGILVVRGYNTKEQIDTLLGIVKIKRQPKKVKAEKSNKTATTTTTRWKRRKTARSSSSPPLI